MNNTEETRATPNEIKGGIRHCATCHLPAVGGHRETIQGKFQKVGHSFFCTGPCKRTLEECGYAPARSSTGR